MRNLSAFLAFTVLSLGMVACQTEPLVASGPKDAPATPPPPLSASLPESMELPSSEITELRVQTDSVESQQYGSTCDWEGDYYGNGVNNCYSVLSDGEAGWIYGFMQGYTSCYITLTQGGVWLPWELWTGVEMCN